MARGGYREGAGRRKNTPEDKGDGKIGKGWATKVLNRIGELQLKAAGEDGKPGKDIQSAEDYALDILRLRDAESRSFFKLLLAYKHGKPVQPVMTADTREIAPELDFDGLRMPAAPKLAAAGKPN
jgi:hypothetical protein